MSRIAYVNGRYERHGEASVHIEDRGFQFADAVYEVWSVFDGRLADYSGHMLRLWRSLDALSIPHPMSEPALSVILNTVIRKNRIREGMVYLQVSRGAAPRDHVFPGADLPPTVVVTAKAVDRAQHARKAAQGVAVITVPENRWGRCDIKTVGLLPNCMAKTTARDAGASEAWFVDAEGYVTEGTSTNAWIVTPDGAIVTRDLGANILHGVTRRTILALAAEQGLRFEERPFTVDEAKAAAEAFFSAATALVMPAVSIDGVKIGDGTPGPVARGLREAYINRAFVTAE